jgi:hypothetical protein
MPNHRHLHSHPHSHTRGTLDLKIVGNTGAAWDDHGADVSGAFYRDGYGVESEDGNGGNNQGIKFDSSRDGASTWSGHTSTDDTEGGEYVGGGKPHNNMPPYLVVHRWHRIA